MLYQVLTDEDFAATTAMDLNAGVRGILRDGGVVAEHHHTAGFADHDSGAIVAGGDEAEGLAGETGFDHGFDDAPWGPGFFAAWLQNHGNTEREGGNPKSIDGRRVARENNREVVGDATEADRGSTLVAVATVKDGEVEPSGEALENDFDLPKDGGEARHVHADEAEGKAAGGGELADVVFRGLDLAIDADRQGVMQEYFASAFDHFHTLEGWNGAEGLARGGGVHELAGDETAIRLTDPDDGLAGGNVGDFGDIEAGVGLALAEDGKFWNHEEESDGEDLSWI